MRSKSTTLAARPISAILSILATTMTLAAGGHASVPMFSENDQATSFDLGINQSAVDSNAIGVAASYLSPSIGGSDGTGSVGYGSFAQSGLMGGSSYATAVGLNFSGVGGSASSSATSLIEVLVTPPTGLSVGDTFEYDVNFTLAGSLQVTGLCTASCFGAASVSISFGAGQDPSGNPLASGGSFIGEASVSTSGGTGGSGVLSGFPVGGGPAFPVDAVGPMQSAVVTGSLTPLILGFSLATTADVNAVGGTVSGQITADADFLDPFSLAANGPVIDFFDAATGAPLAGFDVNSPDGCVVHDRFVCGQTAQGRPRVSTRPAPGLSSPRPSASPCCIAGAADTRRAPAASAVGSTPPQSKISKATYAPQSHFGQAGGTT